MLLWQLGNFFSSEISGLRYLFEYLYASMSNGKVYLEWNLRFQGLDIWVFLCFYGNWESLSRVGLRISGLRYLFEYLYAFMSTGKVYLEWGLVFQGLDIWVSLCFYVDWESLSQVGDRISVLPVNIDFICLFPLKINFRFQMILCWLGKFTSSGRFYVFPVEIKTKILK